MDFLNILFPALWAVTTVIFAVVLTISIRYQKKWKKTFCLWNDALENGVAKDWKILKDICDSLAGRIEALEKARDELEKKVAYNLKTMESHGGELTGLNMDMERVSQYQSEIDALRAEVEGLKLDYREAQNAASQINDYAGHLANIFSYDPLEEMKKARKESGDG